MKKLSKYIKRELIFEIVYVFIFYIFFLPLACFCYEPAKTITITKEDIINAKPKPLYEVEFSQKELKRIRAMEKRHFNKTYDDMSDADRLLQLEYELLDKPWIYTPKKDRIRTLEVASSNYMLSGMALPVNLSSNRTIKRLRNDAVQRKEKDNVGLIDGFLRLISPEKYEIYRQTSKRMFEDYEYGY